ncbi:YqzE family protein [Gorillibacterium timonense]|uniref:YqzE family protein n=1 Tax=Gorillibacterium timonense TaxID=1689269 RepID=UPI00071CDA76|nr:YqzE family protein [Gorillibacterium timonense]
MASKRDDLVKYITERVVIYIDTPKEQRRAAREAVKPKEPWKVRWFGMIPDSLRLLFGGKRK